MIAIFLLVTTKQTFDCQLLGLIDKITLSFNRTSICDPKDRVLPPLPMFANRPRFFQIVIFQISVPRIEVSITKNDQTYLVGCSVCLKIKA